MQQTRDANISVGQKLQSDQDIRPAIFGVTLGSMMLVQVLGVGGELFIQASSVFVLLVGFLIVASYKPTHSISSIVVFLLTVFSIVILASAVQSFDALGRGPIIRVLAVLGFLLLGYLFARRRGHEIVERALPVCAITFVLVLGYVLIDNDRHFARLTGHLHSNLWGFVASTMLVGVIYSKVNVAIRITLIAFVIYLLAFEFQTRGAFLLAVLSVFAFGGIEALRDISTSSNALLKCILLSLFLTIGIISFIFVADFVSVQILQTESETRGLGSGLSGRTGLWLFFLNLYAERPIFGYGLDMSRFYAENYSSSDLVGEISSTHNSYITILFELGLVGAVFYLGLLIMMFVGSLRSRSLMFFAFLLTSALAGLTESRPLNIGNTSAILFVLLIPYCASSAFAASRTTKASTPPRNQ